MKKNLFNVSKKFSKKFLALFLVLTMVFSTNVFYAMKIVYANETENNEIDKSITNENLLMNEVDENNSLEEEIITNKKEDVLNEESPKEEQKEDELKEKDILNEFEDEVEPEEKIIDDVGNLEDAIEKEPEEEILNEVENDIEPEEEIVEDEPNKDILNEEEQVEINENDDFNEEELNIENKIIKEENDVTVNEEIKEESNNEELEENSLNEEVLKKNDEENSNEKEPKEEEIDNEEKDNEIKNEVSNNEELEEDISDKEEIPIEKTSDLENDKENSGKDNNEVVKEAIIDDKKVDVINNVEEEIKVEVKEKKILGITPKSYTVDTSSWTGGYVTTGSQYDVQIDIYSNDEFPGLGYLSGWYGESLDLKLGKPTPNAGFKFIGWDVHFDPSGIVWTNSVDSDVVDLSELDYHINTDADGNLTDGAGAIIENKYIYDSGDLVITAEPIFIRSITYTVDTSSWSGSYEITPTNADVQVDIYSANYSELMDDTLSGWLVENCDLHLGKPSRAGYVFKKWDVYFDASNLVWNNTSGDGDTVDDLDEIIETDDEGNYGGLFGKTADAKFEYVSGDLIITAKPLWSKTYDVDLNWSGDYDITTTKTDVQVDIYSGNYYEDMEATLSGWLTECLELHLGKPKRDGYNFEKWIINFVDNFVWNPAQASYNDDKETDNEGNYDGDFGRPLDASVVENGGDLEITAEPQWSKKIYEIGLNDNGGSGGNGMIYEWHTQGKYSDNECNNAITSVTPPTKVNDEFQGYYFNGTKYINEDGTFTAEFTNDAFSNNETLEAHWANSSSGNTWTETIHVNKLWSGDYEIPGTNDTINFTFKSGYPDANANGWVTDHYQLVLGKAKQDGYWLNGWNIDWYDNTVWNPSVDPMEIHGDFANDEGKNDGSRDRNLNANTTYISGSIDIKATPKWRKKIWGIHLEDNGGQGGSGTIFEWHTKGFYSDNECNNLITSVKVPKKNGNEFLGYFLNGTKYIENNGSFTSNFTANAFNQDTHLKAEWKSTNRRQNTDSSGGGGSSGGSGFVSTNNNSIKTWGSNGLTEGTIVFDDKTQSYRNIDGTPVISQWIGKQGIGNTVIWCYIGINSELSKGWQNLNGSIYYFDERGNMLTGKQIIDGIEYYFSDAQNGEEGKLVIK